MPQEMIHPVPYYRVKAFFCRIIAFQASGLLNQRSLPGKGAGLLVDDCVLFGVAHSSA
jgi:hypothetical protein